MKKLLFLLLFFPALVKAQLPDFHYVVIPTLAPLLSDNPTSLTCTSITGTQGGSQVTVLSWANLGSNSIVITAPTGYVVSLNNSSFSSSQTITNPGTSGSQNVYLALSSSNSPGVVNGTATVVCSGLSLSAPVTLSGTVSGIPTLGASPGTLTMTAVVGSQGLADSMTIVGSNLGTNVVNVTLPSGYVGGLNISSLGASSPATINPTAGSVNVKFYYALSSGNAAGTNNATSVVSCPGAGTSSTNISLNGTISATAATMFVFSRTSRPVPTIGGTTLVPMVGDPFTTVITGSANGISCTSNTAGGSGPWQATGSPLAASNDSLGMLGSTMPGGLCPDSLLYRGWFSVSSSNRLADSVNQTLAKPNLTFSGMTVGHTYTVTIYSSINTRYSGFHSTVHNTVVGSTTQSSAALALLSNKSTPITYTIQPNSSGILNVYLFTDGAATSAINAVEAINIAP